MARIYGWSDGEGRYKGLGAVSQNSLDIINLSKDYVGNINPDTGLSKSLDWLTQPMSDGTEDWSVDDWTNYYRDQTRNYNPSNTSVGGQTLGKWVKDNQSMLVLGALAGLLFFGRR